MISGLSIAVVQKINPPEYNELISRLDGTYRVTGKNPNGTPYQGEAVITHEDGRYEVTWRIADKQTFCGSGTLKGNVLTINWSGGLVTYVVQKDGTLQGSWAGGEGTETLTHTR